jgi:endonuclease/exonuclease/phosphatase family metal-dependent hydrolase
MGQVRMSRKLRAASYNIRKAVGLDRRRDPMRILDVINRLDADVVALQEVDRRLGPRPSVLDRDAIARETDFEVAPLALNDVSLGWHGNAMLVRKGVEVTRAGHIDLPGFEPRGAVSIGLRKDGADVTLVGAHLGLVRSSRLLQLAAIRSWLKDHDLTRSLIVGDFNEWSARRGLEPLVEDFEVISPGKSFHAARPVAGLDRLALGRALKLTDAGVEEGRKARRASDHLPIWGDIEF